MPNATEAVVMAATLADGTPAVLKVLLPRWRANAAHEIAVLRHAAGHGCVTLLDDDADRGALLLERLGPSLYQLAMPFEQRIPVLIDVARAMWRPAPHLGLPTGADMARRQAAEIAELWDRYDRPCSEGAIEAALACAARRAADHDDERAVLVHGDVHQWNALQTLDGSGYKLIDPDGLVAEPEFDMGVLMREDLDELVAGGARARAAHLAAATGLDAERIWEWGVIQRAWNGLLSLDTGMAETGRHILDIVDALAVE